jgi:hypothetical protein
LRFLTVGSNAEVSLAQKFNARSTKHFPKTSITGGRRLPVTEEI